MIVTSAGQGVFSTASSSILSPTLEISLPAPAVVLQAPSSGAAPPRSAIRVRVNNVVLLNMALPMIWVSGAVTEREQALALPQIGVACSAMPVRAWGYPMPAVDGDAAD